MVLNANLAPWSKSVSKPATEFPLTPLSVIAGAIPPGLNGSLYRNGPARLSRGQERVGHWFDGDGAILGIHFANSQACGVYRYVQTKGYQEETAQDSFIYPNYGRKAAGAFWNNWFKPVKNSANTSVLSLQDRLLALWEGGKPYALDLSDLSTIGKDNLSSLTDKQSFSAHPKVDLAAGKVFNFGVSAGVNATLNLYFCDRATGKIEKQNSHNLSGLPLIHDFALAGNYLVFFIPPVRVNLTSVIFGKKSYSDALEWKPELGTEILVFDRDTLNLVSQNKTDPFYQWHFTNGCIDRDGNIDIEFVRYEDFKTNQYLKEVPTGNIQTPAKGTLWSIKLNPQTAKVITTKQLNNTRCEFPVTHPQNVGQPWRYTYMSVPHYGKTTGLDLLTSIAAYDRHTNNLSIANMGKNRYPSEPIFIPQADRYPHGWLITVVYDANQDCSEVWLYKSDRLFEKPVFRIALPGVIPPSFHGTWKQN